MAVVASKVKLINTAGDVIPVIAQVKDGDLPTEVAQTLVEMEGEVTDVTSGGFTLITEYNTMLDVVFRDNVIVLLEDGLTLDTLEAGMYVEVYGFLADDLLTIDAYKVELETRDDDDYDDGDTEVEGYITAINGSTLTIDIKHADFMPTSNTIDINITETTHSANVDLSTLMVGQEIEAEGIMEADGSITAMSIELEDHEDEVDESDDSSETESVEDSTSVDTTAVI